MSGIVRAFLYVPVIMSSGVIKGKKVILAEDTVYNEAQARERVDAWKEIYSQHGNIPDIAYEYIPPRVVM